MNWYKSLLSYESSYSIPFIMEANQKNNFTSWKLLVEYLELDTAKQQKIITHRFPLNLPLRLAEKIQKNSLDDPILKQFLTIDDELTSAKGFTIDPVGDEASRKETRLLHKYYGRALLLVSSACSMHCRYCFRKNMDYGVNFDFFEKELEIIQNTPSLSEIILSGGDPLSLSNELLEKLLRSLENISHIKRLRIHTRFPIGIPERIDQSLLDLFQTIRMQTVFVIHCNHPKELDSDILKKLKELQQLAIPVLNQSVLLKGVNDNPETFITLNRMLINHGIIPYYLHQLDRAVGTHHFEVAEKKGKEIIEALQKHLPGYAVPRYVKEIPGLPCKYAIL